MPVGAKEDQAPDGLTDIVARQSKDAQTSDHPMHDSNRQSVGQGAEILRKGPAVPESML